MKRGLLYYIQIFGIGTFVGSFIAAVIFSDWIATIIGGVSTGVLYLGTIYLCSLLKKPKLEVFFLYAISGILPGFLLGGNTSLGLGKTGTVIGSIICFILFGLLAVTFIRLVV